MKSVVKFTWERKTSQITCLTTHLLETCMSTVKFLPLIIFALVFHNLWNAVWFQFLCLYRVIYLGTRLTSQLTDRGQPGLLFCLVGHIRLVDLFSWIISRHIALSPFHCKYLTSPHWHWQPKLSRSTLIRPLFCLGAVINRWAWSFWLLKHLLKYHF